MLPLLLLLVIGVGLFCHPKAAWPGTPPVTKRYGSGTADFSLAAASPGELGLLELLGETYCTQAGCTLEWIKAGSGVSLELLKNGHVDMIMVHAPAGARQAVAEGWAGRKTLVASNAFVLVGPADDPAGIADATCAVEAYRRIARAQALFFSRGDNSGTHKKELAFWQDAGIAPSGDWYVMTRDFMTATLQRAHEAGGYFMTDSSTWAVERATLPRLQVLFAGDEKFINIYEALCRLDKGRPCSYLAAGFIDFVASPEGQRLIATFGRAAYGESLYRAAAFGAHDR